MYTAYLVERMQRQALEEQRRKEKKEKKQAKEDLKEKVVVCSKTEICNIMDEKYNYQLQAFQCREQFKNQNLKLIV